ncbi:P-loop containing nucleoside triphosphate hydrolase protein, partial [Polyplosphaeria fusca]
ELMGDLQEYFDPESEEYYHSTGAPFRRGYLLYGPPGTGKTSLTQAIASEFNVPLYLVNLSNMTDQELDHAFTMLPHRCVVVFEDIDSMGIVRENKMKQKEPSNPQMQRTQREFTPSDSSDKPKPKTLVTLSGLLNVIDGAGAKDGRLLIMTSNAPDSLDEALIRDGRIDMEIYMKKSDAIMAAITFKRCFGSDPRRKISNSELDRLSILFGEQIPDDAFATCEIQNYCMKYRGRPEKAVENFSHFIEQK